MPQDADVTRDAHGRTPPRGGRPLLWLVGGAGALLLVVVVTVFQPQRLLYDDVVDEALPAADPGGSSPGQETTETQVPSEEETAATTPVDEEETAADTEPDAAPPVATEPQVLAAGTFGSLGRYSTVGEVRVLELADGQRYLRLEGFETTNGPDLYVYLTTGPADGSGDFTASFVDLGRLRGNVGDQNYEIPADVDLEDFTGVVIYCARFSSPFGAADLATT